jgi:nitric oxide dioxygenase
MTEKQISLIKKSWKTFRSMDPAIVGDAFYSKLFHEHPEFRKMFPRNMEDQYRKLTEMLSVLVIRLDQMDQLSSEIAAMGMRHKGYGVKSSHYKVVGEALLWTLRQGLGKEWTPETEEAWITCYQTISDIMIQAAEKTGIHPS